MFGISLLSADEPELYSVEGAKTVVDPDTTNAWSNIAASSTSTENIGRIWTDKSVFDDDYDFTGALEGTSVVKGKDSDFLVGLSAISSTSNLTSKVTRTDPLDIVLIIDRSSSMNDGIEQTGSYVEVSANDVEESRGHSEYREQWSIFGTLRGNYAEQDSVGGEYYALVNDEYVRIHEVTETVYGDGDFSRTSYEEHVRWTLNGETVTPQDTPFYEYRPGETISRMEALKTAANNFIDSAANLPNSDQIRIGIVSFAGSSEYDQNASRINQQLTNLSGNNAQGLKNTVNGINAPGSGAGTYPSGAFDDAQSMLRSSAQGTQKVVIFFTDGGPGGTTSSVLSNNVANQAINSAHTVKQSGTKIYSVGVLDGANPSADISDVTNSSNATLRVNAYMHAVSSNYPNATGFTSNAIGDRAPNSDYYKAATNADELNNIFKDIFHEIETNYGSGSPIEEVVDEEGAQNTPGYLTFTDTLGSFMEVTGVGANNNRMYLAFADGLHEGTPNEDGTVWTFSGVVNEGSDDHGVNTAYPEGANLSEIKVTVTKSNDLATGDTITVQIPASLIPMRNYDVDTDNGTMTVSNTYPVRLFYGVSVKDGAIDALNDPQNENHDAVLAQTSTDGTTVDFYSNSFVQGATEGSTEASFTPSDGNKFYYYPVNTQLFIDENCTQPATRYNIGNYSKLYYQDSYWQLTGNGNEAEEVPANGSITRSGNDWNVTYQGNNAYIAANTPRADRPATLVSNKAGNTTGTASTVLTPTWNGASVSQKLGNNGKLSVDAPGDLRIDKNVYWGNASDDTKTDKNNFKFTVHLYTVAEDGAQTNLTNKYDYAVYGTGETPVSTGTISDNGEITLKGGQYVVISDLPNGAQYTVTEQAANQNGFTTTDNSTGENAKTDDGVVEGTIVGGDQQAAVFTNTYHATEVTLEGANQLIKVRKNLAGREWQDTDEFRFTMRPEGDAPVPESTDAVVVDDEDAVTDYTVNLSNITFENPGTFTYVIEEDNDTNPIAGIDYSNETYAVTITVVDNGTGKLEIQSVQFTQRADVDGNTPAEQPQITNNTVVFTNNYDADEATTNLNGTKDYTDNSGANPNAANKFTFELKAIGGYETEGGSADNPTIGAAVVPMPEGADTDTHTITIGNNGTNPDGFAFQTIKYNGTHLNNTYIYEIREVIPQGATNNGNGTWSLNGMTYDGTVHTVNVAITDKPNEQGEGMHIVATPSMQPADVKFTNVYDPEDYTLEGEEAIHGTKVLQGREIGDNETFYFELKQTSGPETVLTGSEVKTVTKDSGMDFAFSKLTFSKAGTYTFTVNEVADDQGTEITNGKGMTYSQNVAKVTIKVKDGGNGALVLDGPVVYENQGSNETGKAVFTNVYEASLNYGAQGAGGINVTKQLLDRPMTAGEFNFTITGEGEAADLTAEADKNFQNTGAAADQTITMAKLQSLTFDETDAGKTYTFIVEETEPAEGDGLAGVTYDKSQYKVEIEVVDNGNGTMHAVTTVTQTMDKDGNEIADGGKVVVDHANSDDADYAVPTFGFVNDYNPNPVDMGEDANKALQVTKKVKGAPSAADYTFTLTAQNTAVGPVANIEGLDENHQTTETTSGTIEAGGTQTLTFDTLTFTEPGTYTFTVQENQPAADEGWTFDTDPRTITVEVTDINPAYEPGGDAPQYDGNLYIGEVTGNNPTIENKYDHGTVTIGGDAEEALTVVKTVKGWSTDADFNFTFVPVKEEGVDWGTVQIAEGADKTAVTEKFADSDMHSAKFGEITFTEPGTYKFNVTEDEAHDETADPAGWTYDKSTQTITVTVSETDAAGNYDGKLHAAVSGPARFENTYKTGTLSISKTVVVDETEGTEIDTGKLFEFTVNLTDTKDNALTGTYAIEGAFDKDGNALTSVTDGTKVYLHHGDSATVKGLPAGTQVKVTETVPDGYTADRAERTGAIIADANTLFAFTNTYSTDPGTVSEGTESAFNLTKQLTGRDENNSWAADDEFTFTLTPGTATDLEGNPVEDLTVPMPADSVDGIKKVTVGADKAGENGIASIDFGAISYERTGIYTYTVQEIGADGELGKGGYADGITYDGRTVNIRVTVTDNGTGGLVAAVAKTGEAETASFVNTYDSTFDYGANGQGGIDITKMLMNREMAEGQFTLTVTAADDASAGKIGDSKTVEMKSAAAAANTAASVTGNPFGSVKFDRSDSGKTFTYTIEETGTAPDGYTYDTDKFTVEIEPVDNGDGTMSVTTDVSGKDGYSQTVTSTMANPQKAIVSFVNIYDADDVTIGAEGDTTIKATKVLENDDIANYDGEFTFKVTSGDTEVTTGKNDADGSITFDTITYTSENLYAAAHGGSDEVGTASLDTTGDNDVYTFVYNVSEDPVTVGGVTYKSGNDSSVTVTVSDDRAGKLTIDVAYTPEADGLVFTNTYGAGEEGTVELTLDGNKTLTGVNGAIPPTLTDGMFEFTISGEEGTPMPADKMVTNKGTGISFGPIEYTMANVFGADAVDDATEDEAVDQTDEAVAGETATAENEGVETYTAGRTKTFIYTITETNGGKTIDGITYDGATKTVEVTVTDEGNGRISAKVTKVTEGTDENMDFTFDNTYAVEDKPSSPTGDGALTITKKLSGRDMNAGEFTFQLVSNSNKDEVYTATNDADGNVSFDPITFTKAGEYSYTLTEVVPDGAKPVDGGYEKDGVFYPSVSYTVTATVADNHDGTLSVAWSMADGAGEPATEAVFKNTYKAAPTSVTLEAAKTLEGRAVQKGEFSFKLFDADGNVVDEATNDESGVISFESLTFEKAGTYTYTVSEVVPEEDQDPDTDGVQNGGITYDQTVYTVEIVVTDNGKGSLVVDSITYKIGDKVENALRFNNIYKTQPTDPTDPTDNESWLKVTKELANRDLKAGEFTFQMRYVSGGNADAVTPKSITTTNDANGNVVFNQEGNTGFVFSEEGVYTFIISEIEGDDANIDYDDTEYTVVAKVTKNAETGELEVDWQLLNAEGNVVEENPSITFHNVYKKPVTPPTPEDPDPSDPSKPDTDVDKKLTGRDLVDGEFSFVITATGDNASHVSPKSLTGTNDASGNVTFGGKGFVFDKADDYTFTVSEVLPADDDPEIEGVQHNGVTYDETTFTITAHVTEQNGKLVVTWENADAPMVFENEYEPSESVDITFGATKVLEGRDLATGEFSFELRDQDGNVVATATNAADGSIVFTSPVTFTEPGEYTYTIVEVSGNVSGVTYDDAVHTAVVTVTDNGDGTLSATVTYDGSGKLPVFTNVFTPSEPGTPAEPGKPSKPGIPQTGDFAVAAIGGTGLAAVALIATGLYLRRRNSH
ncbi:FctA domain-containing protein [Collinsella tanakaei]|uniref:Spy0128 family protein n=1 Tax=Collinsella tanakaei TaxID=626935 RepID=UPI0025A3A578|nr:FctA domain-containing protein [Collinsella tanakaei]MDM8246136.1 FctA domain-containing protein [Collinsella tanakaei]